MRFQSAQVYIVYMVGRKVFSLTFQCSFMYLVIETEARSTDCPIDRGMEPAIGFPEEKKIRNISISPAKS